MLVLKYDEQQERSIIGFTFSPAKEGDWFEENISCLFIDSDDFDQFLFPCMKVIYPRAEAEFRDFDYCFDNPINKEEWVKIFSVMEQKMDKIPDDDKLRCFFQKLIEWINEQFEWADEIIVSGNQ